MYKLGLKTGGHHTNFSLYRSKDQRYCETGTKETVFVYILGFIFYAVSHAKTDLHDIYMIQLCVWLIF